MCKILYILIGIGLNSRILNSVGATTIIIDVRTWGIQINAIKNIPIVSQVMKFASLATNVINSTDPIQAS